MAEREGRKECDPIWSGESDKRKPPGIEHDTMVRQSHTVPFMVG